MVEPSYLERAELLADLGHCEEAADELAAARADDAPAQTLLARLRLHGGERRPALAAAQAAVAAAPQDLAALTVYGRALAALGQVDEAAAQAEQLLKRGRGEAAAATGAAEILSTVRVGQLALDAAWEGVRLAPERPLGHLLLGVIAAELTLTEIAERAYREAQALEPTLPDVPAEAGLARLELRRHAVRLAQLLGAERSGGRPRAEARPDPRSEPRSESRSESRPEPWPAGGAGQGSAAQSDPADLPSAGAGDGPSATSDELTRLLRRGAGYGLLGALIVAWAHVATDLAPMIAAVLAGLGLGGLMLARRRLPEPLRSELVTRLQSDRSLLLPTWALYAVPLALFLYGLFALPWLLVAAVAAAVVAFVSARR